MDFDFDADTFYVLDEYGINSRQLIGYFMVSFFVGALVTIVRWIYVK